MRVKVRRAEPEAASRARRDRIASPFGALPGTSSPLLCAGVLTFGLQIITWALRVVTCSPYVRSHLWKPKQEQHPPEGVFDEKTAIFRRLTMRS